MGCAPNTISGYEGGRTRIDILALQRLCDHARISADWIVSGVLGSLPHDVAVKIQAAQRAGQDVIKAKRGRPRRTPDMPTVAEVPAWPPDPPSRTVHEPGASFLPALKSTPRDKLA
jgi:transcriptional regulator with XRE-family HTH domain